MSQGQRAIWHDYKGVGFYMLTLATAGRRPLFGRVVAPGAMELSPAGHQVLEAWRAMPSFTPQLETTTLCLMPDHLHGIVSVRERLERPLGAIIRGFKSGVTAALRKASNNPSLEVWEEGFYDGVALEPAMLHAWHRYILDNPRRLWLKRQHPDLFVRVNALEHERLPSLPDGRTWAGYGNLFLLDRPELVQVRVSRSATQDEIAHVSSEIAAKVRQGAVAVSPFISPGEQAVVAAVAAEKAVNNDGSRNKSSGDEGAGQSSCNKSEGGGLIVLKHGGFPPLYKPSGRYFDLCASGRLLVLSAFAYTSRKQPLTREQCLAMNGWCEKLARPGQ
jgi:REP element-mobilizing transposase RayT